MLLAEHPYAVFFFMLVLIIICGLASFLPQFNAPDFPDFSTPVMVRMIPSLISAQKAISKRILGKH